MRDPTVDIQRLGAEDEPVILLDDFSPQAGTLLEAARQASYAPAGHHYPGVRAPAPAGYLQERGALLSRLIGEVFGLTAGADLIESSYSMVTTPPARLTPIQRLPHFDGTDPKRLALLHYLCGPEAGGTSFYRHRATGFETITEARLPAYDAALRREVGEDGLPPAAYFAGSTPRFERVGGVAAAFNRLVIYRGLRLHSGDILQPPGEDAADPQTARITINTFLAAR